MAQAVQVEALWSGLTNNSGQPLAAGKVQVYFAGTTTPVSLYTAADKSTSATNPIILDGYGRAQVWADGKYRFVVKDSADVTLYTLDNVLYGFDDSQLVWGGTSAGTGSVVTVTAPSVTQYDDGQRLCFIAASTNSGPVTVNVNGLGSVSVVKGPSAVPLVSGDLLAGQVVNLTYQVVGGVGRYRLDSYPTVADIQGNVITTATNVAGTNAITGTLTPSPTQYVTGQVIRFKAVNSNTAAVTAQFVSTLAALAVQRYGAALVGGEIQAGDIVELVYDGTQFQLVNAVPAPLFLDRTNSRLGVGTTSPQYSIDVQNTDGLSQSLTRYSANANSSLISLRKSRGATVGANTIVNSGDTLGAIYFEGANGSGFVPAAAITATVGGTPGATNDMPGEMQFSTCADGSGSLAERMRLTSDGTLAIGRTSNLAAFYGLDVQRNNASEGGIRVTNPNGGASAYTAITLGNDQSPAGSWIILNSSANTNFGGAYSLNFINAFAAKISFFTNGSSSTSERLYISKDGDKVFQHGYVVLANNSTYQSSGASLTYNLQNGHVTWTGSSALIKKNITPIVYGLETVKALQPRSYTRVDDDKQDIGFIADEMNTVIPEVVLFGPKKRLTNNEADTQSLPLSISYDRLTAVLCKAIQELSAKVDLLEAKLAGE
jgi:hypothetical protein